MLPLLPGLLLLPHAPQLCCGVSEDPGEVGDSRHLQGQAGVEGRQVEHQLHELNLRVDWADNCINNLPQTG